MTDGHRVDEDARMSRAWEHVRRLDVRARAPETLRARVVERWRQQQASATQGEPIAHMWSRSAFWRVSAVAAAGVVLVVGATAVGRLVPSPRTARVAAPPLASIPTPPLPPAQSASAVAHPPAIRPTVTRVVSRPQPAPDAATGLSAPVTEPLQLVHVRLRQSDLPLLGLPMSPLDDGSVIEVEMIVGIDGRPLALRRTGNESSNPLQP